MPFIDNFMEASKESEAPESFFFWSALAAISAVVKRNVWIPRSIPSLPRTYPNIFVFLLADSGLRKGGPIAFAKELVAEVNNTRIISGRSSIQGIITALGTAFTLPDGRVIDTASGFISASEFSSSIVRDQDALTILTDLYDSCYHDKWVDMLRGGKVELKEPSITLLAGINPPHFEDFISPTAIAGGFIGRSFIVFEEKKARINPAVRLSSNSVVDKKKLVEELKIISTVQGPMIWAEDALMTYEEWYYEFESRDKGKDKTGTVNRVGENILKVSMLLSLSRSPDTLLVKDDVEKAISICTTSLSNVNKATVGQGKSQMAYQTKLVLTELLSSKDFEISRQRLLRQNWGAIDAFDLDRVIDSLIQSGGVVQETRGNQIYYKLTPMAIQQIEGSSLSIRRK